MNTVEAALAQRPYTIAYLAPILGVRLHQVYRMIEGKAPFTLSAASKMADLLDRPFSELFEERSYWQGRARGWFPKALTKEEEEVAI